MTTTAPTTLTAVDTLRLAAQAIRDIAADATDGPWERNPRHGGIWVPGEEYGRAPALVVSGGAVQARDADHIVAWQPSVTPAAADLLDAIADEVQSLDEHDGFDSYVTISGYAQALTFACAFLGQERAA